MADETALASPWPGRIVSWFGGISAHVKSDAARQQDEERAKAAQGKADRDSRENDAPGDIHSP